jgi:hypothetical protein
MAIAMFLPVAYAWRMKSNITAKKPRKLDMPQGRPPLPAGTARTANVSVTTTQPQRAALVAIAKREKRPIAHIVMDALREKYANDFNDL